MFIAAKCANQPSLSYESESAFSTALATGSAFTNGFARLLPGPYHVPIFFHLPKLLPLGQLIFWFIRVRFTRWHRA